MPKLLAVQAAACAPLADAFAAGRDEVDPAKSWGTSLAGGINIADPPRAAEILAAVRASGGAIVTVEEDEIAVAREALAAPRRPRRAHLGDGLGGSHRGRGRAGGRGRRADWIRVEGGALRWRSGTT